MAAGVRADLERHLGAIVAAFPEVAVAYLFGSRARGDAHQGSDLDIGIVYHRGVDHAAIHDRLVGRLAPEVAKASGQDAVDVVDLESQGPIFCHQVLLDGRPIHVADEARRVDFESTTLVLAFDFRPTYDLATRGKPSAFRRWLQERYDLRPSPVQARHPQGESGQAG